MTFFIERETQYQNTGRMQTEEEAVNIDKALKEILDANDIPYRTSKTTSAVMDIIAALSMKIGPFHA